MIKNRPLETSVLYKGKADKMASLRSEKVVGHLGLEPRTSVLSD